MNANGVASRLYILADQMERTARDMEALFNELWASPTYSSTIWPLLHHSSELRGAAQVARNWAEEMATIKFVGGDNVH